MVEFVKRFFRIEDKRNKKEGEILNPFWVNLLNGFADDVDYIRKHIKLSFLFSLLMFIAISVIGSLLVAHAPDDLNPVLDVVIQIFYGLIVYGSYLFVCVYSFFANIYHDIKRMLIPAGMSLAATFLYCLILKIAF